MMDAASTKQLPLHPDAKRVRVQGFLSGSRLLSDSHFVGDSGCRWSFGGRVLQAKPPRSATEFRFAIEPAAAMRYDFAMVMIFGSNGFFRAHSRDLRLSYDRMSTMRISSCWELIVSFW